MHSHTAPSRRFYGRSLGPAGAIEELKQHSNLANLGVALSKILFQKGFSKLDTDDFAVTQGIHKRTLASPTTVYAKLKESAINSRVKPCLSQVKSSIRSAEG